MLISQSVISKPPIEGKEFHIFFASLSSFKNFLFVLGIFTFFASPMLGCIPILIFLQFRISKRYLKNESLSTRENSRFYMKNLIYLSLILFALVTYASTVEKNGNDISGNLYLYNQLSGYNIHEFFNYLSSIGTEPLAFFIPHLAGMLFGHSDNLFILIQALTFNLIFTILAYRVFPLFYPTVILINITSFSYFEHIYVMRQWYSNLFLLPMTIIPSIGSNLLLPIFAYLSHRSSVVFSAPLLFLLLLFNIEKLSFFNSRILKQFKIKFINLLFSKVFIILSIFLASTIAYSLLYYYVSLDLVATAKLEFYSEIEGDFYLSLLIPTILPEFIISIIIIFLLPPARINFVRDYTKYSWLTIIITSTALAIFIYLNDLPSVISRPILVWSGLKGFFYPCLFLIVQRLKFRYRSLFTYLLITLIFVSVIRFLAFHLISIFIVYQEGDILNRWMSARYPLLFTFGIFGKFIAYPNHFQNNDIPTIANNLFDYLLHLYNLIQSIGS